MGGGAPQSVPTSSCGRNPCDLPVPTLWTLAINTPKPAQPATTGHQLIKPILGNLLVWGSWAACWPPSRFLLLPSWQPWEATAVY